MSGAGSQRIDKWLFFARAVKSRTLAAKLVLAAKVRVNREKVDQAAYPVRPGDVLTITLDRRVLVWRVVSAGARRGPADEARGLYEDLTPPPKPVSETLMAGMPPVRDAGSGRPTKKDRRDLDALRGED